MCLMHMYNNEIIRKISVNDIKQIEKTERIFRSDVGKNKFRIEKINMAMFLLLEARGQLRYKYM